MLHGQCWTNGVAPRPVAGSTLSVLQRNAERYSCTALRVVMHDGARIYRKLDGVWTMTYGRTAAVGGPSLA